MDHAQRRLPAGSALSDAARLAVQMSASLCTVLLSFFGQALNGYQLNSAEGEGEVSAGAESGFGTASLSLWIGRTRH